MLSEEHAFERVGSLGASAVGVALERLEKGKRKGAWSQASLDFMYELAAERLTGVPARRVNAMRWGEEHEDEARASYGFLTNFAVEKVNGVIRHPRLLHTHASPDSLVGDDGGLEIKCPTSATHLKTWHEGVVPERHLPQIQWNMACAGRAWWDFLSYDPRFPQQELQFFIKRVARDQAFIDVMEADVAAFNGDLQAILDKVTNG
jgi:predicted phage-related endonuclease